MRAAVVRAAGVRFVVRELRGVVRAERVVVVRASALRCVARRVSLGVMYIVVGV